jgi:hypothetical protein
MDEVKTTEIPQAAEPPEPPSEPKQFTKLGEDIGEPAPSQPLKSPEPPPVSPLPISAEPSGIGQLWKSVLATQVSQRTWLVVATVFLGMVILLIFSFIPRRSPQAKPTDHTLESITPELVTARCGQPAEDVTKDLYPMMTRTTSPPDSGASSWNSPGRRKKIANGSFCR